MNGYERVAERIWDSPPHTTKEEIAAILREEFPPAPDVAALQDIITRLIGCLVPFIGQRTDDAGKPSLTHCQELGHKTIGEAAALLRYEPKEERP